MLLLLLFSSHRSLWMISEVLEFPVDGGRVTHSQCMCIISHSLDGDGGWYECGMKPGGLVACREMSDHLPSEMLCTDDSRSHRQPGTQLWLW